MSKLQLETYCKKKLFTVLILCGLLLFVNACSSNTVTNDEELIVKEVQTGNTKTAATIIQKESSEDPVVETSSESLTEWR